MPIVIDLTDDSVSESISSIQSTQVNRPLKPPTSLFPAPEPQLTPQQIAIQRLLKKQASISDMLRKNLMPE